MINSDLVKLQLELECIGFDHQGLLTRISGKNPDDIAAFYGYRMFEGGSQMFFRADVPSKIRDAVLKRGLDEIFRKPIETVKLLKQEVPNVRHGQFKTYQFQATHRFESMGARKLDSGTSAWGIEVDKKVVSTCSSSRENSNSAEAWVETLPEYRGKGLATKVCWAWAADVIGAGKTAFYSHKVENLPSAALARKLGCVPVFECVSF